uniref:HORMA domain-containing protein n=1 Tax=Chelonoidis abingdonii TaxID=106734 RepID=A0A8C0GBZ6_CHEAB
MVTALGARCRVVHNSSSEIKTHQQSLVMVKRIMAIAVSGITYLRGIFPEDAYSTHYLEDLCVKVLREDSIYPRVSKIVKWYVHS